LIIYIIFLRL